MYIQRSTSKRYTCESRIRKSCVSGQTSPDRIPRDASANKLKPSAKNEQFRLSPHSYSHDLQQKISVLWLFIWKDKDRERHGEGRTICWNAVTMIRLVIYTQTCVTGASQVKLTKPANSMKQRPSSEANKSSAQDIPHTLWKTKVHYRIHNSTPPVPNQPDQSSPCPIPLTKDPS